MDDWKLPRILPDNMQDYETGEWAQIAQWIESLHGTSGRVYRWTWYQLFLDYHLHFPGSSGPWYHQSSKTWRSSETRPTQDLTKCVRWFNSFLQRTAKKLEKPLPVKHMRADSSVLAFWSNTLTVRISEKRQRKVDEWLCEWATCFLPLQRSWLIFLWPSYKSWDFVGASKHRSALPLHRDRPEERKECLGYIGDDILPSYVGSINY